jgi:hypothetical protein
MTPALSNQGGLLLDARRDFDHGAADSNKSPGEISVDMFIYRDATDRAAFSWRIA